MQKEPKRKQRTFYSILGIISDCIIIPVIIIALFSSFILYSNQRKNEVKTVFGVGFAAIQSGSMRAGGFEIGDIVFIVKTNTDNLRPKSEDYEGDIIAFYYEQADRYVNKTLITDFDSFVEPTIPSENLPKRDDKENLVDEYTKIYFHRIVGVYVDEATGIRYFQTQGDSNASPDSYLIREDLVAGKYVNTPIWVRSVFKFCASGMGMIILVILPLTILIFMQMLSLLEQVSALMAERKVVMGQMKFDDKESINANVGYEMRDFDKIYYYDVSKPEDKLEVRDFLWVYPENVKVSKKQRAHLKAVDTALDIYNKKGAKEYWNYWKSYYRGKQKAKIKLLSFVALYVKGGRTYEDALKLAKIDVKKYN